MHFLPAIKHGFHRPDFGLLYGPFWHCAYSRGPDRRRETIEPNTTDLMSALMLVKPSVVLFLKRKPQRPEWGVAARRSEYTHGMLTSIGGSSQKSHFRETVDLWLRTGSRAPPWVLPWRIPPMHYCIRFAVIVSPTNQLSPPSALSSMAHSKLSSAMSKKRIFAFTEFPGVRPMTASKCPSPSMNLP